MRYDVYYLIKVIVTPAVDGYALISGFISSNKEKQNYSKIFVRWSQVVFYSLGLSLVLEIFGIVKLNSIKSIIRLSVPIMGGILVFCLFFCIIFYATIH